MAIREKFILQSVELEQFTWSDCDNRYIKESFIGRFPITLELKITESHEAIEILMETNIRNRNGKRNQNLIDMINQKCALGMFKLVNEEKLEYFEKIHIFQSLSENLIRQVLVITLRYMENRFRKYLFAFYHEFPEDIEDFQVLIGCKNAKMLISKKLSKTVEYSDAEFAKEIEVISRLLKNNFLKKIFLGEFRVNYTEHSIKFLYSKENYKTLNSAYKEDQQLALEIIKLHCNLDQVGLFSNMIQLQNYLKYEELSKALLVSQGSKLFKFLEIKQLSEFEKLSEILEEFNSEQKIIYFSSYFSENISEKIPEFYSAILQIVNKISENPEKKIFLSINNVAYSEGTIYLLQNEFSENDFLLSSPEELNSDFSQPQKSELFRLGLLIYEVALKKENQSKLLEKYLAECRTFEDYQRLLVVNKKIIPISNAVESKFPFLVQIVRELLQSSKRRMDCEKLSFLLTKQLSK